MTEATLIRKFKEEHYGTTSAKDLADTHGVRIRKRDGRYEIATSYFYERQNHTEDLLGYIADFAREHGFDVTPTSPVQFYMRQWPKTSWAVMTVEIHARETVNA